MSHQNWSRGKIRYELERAGYATLTEIDDKYHLPRGNVSAAIRFPMTSGEIAISSALGIHPAEIWPNRYNALGERLSPQPIVSYNAQRVVGQCQKSEAA